MSFHCSFTVSCHERRNIHSNSCNFPQSVRIDCPDRPKFVYNSCNDVFTVLGMASSNFGVCAGMVTFDSDESATVDELVPCTESCNEVWEEINELCSSGDQIFDGDETYSEYMMQYFANKGLFGDCSAAPQATDQPGTCAGIFETIFDLVLIQQYNSRKII